MTSSNDCSCGLREHIQKMIDKCDKEMRQIENTEYDETGLIVLQPEARYEYLEGLRSRLQFMLDYPEREQVV